MKKSLVFSILCLVVQTFSVVSFLLILSPSLINIFTNNTQNSPLLTSVNKIFVAIIFIALIALYAITIKIILKHIITFSKDEIVTTDIKLVLLIYSMLIISFFVPSVIVKSYPLFNHIWITQGITAFIYKLSVYGIGVHQIGIILAAFLATMSISKKREKYAF